MKLLSSLLGLLLSFQLVHGQNTINSVASGDWSSISTWDLGRLPQDGDIIVLQPMHQVVMDRSGHLSNVVLRFSGKLTMAPGVGLTLNSGSIINVLNGGRIEAQNNSGDAWISLGNVVKYRSSKTYDPNWGVGNLLGLAYATSTSGSVDQGGVGFIFGTLPAVWQDLQLFKTPESYVQMIWVTSHESTARTFHIERSKDSRAWKDIGIIRSDGATGGQVIYSFIDNDPGNGTVYYRIAQENGDGSVTTTPIRSVKLGSGTSTQLSAYPNPTHDQVRVVLPQAPEKNLDYEWIDASGHMLRKGTQPAGDRTMVLDMSSLPAGVYFIRLHGTGDMERPIRLVKR